MTEPATAGFDLDLEARIGAAVGQGVSAALGGDDAARRRAWRYELNSKIMPLDIDPMPVVLSGGAGVLDVPRLLGPPLGWTWQLDGISAVGFTTGTVTVFVNNVNGAQVFPFIAAGNFYQRHFRFFRYGQRLVFSAAGITGTVAIGLTGVAYADELQGEVLL